MRAGESLISINLRSNFVQTFFWWSILIFLTFQIRFYDIYIPKEKIVFRDFKYILGCSGFKVEDLECTDYLYGGFLRYFLDQITILHPYTVQVVVAIICISWFPLAYLFVQIEKIPLKLLLLVLFLSPSIGLLIQRGNLDILIFSLCWVAIKLFIRGKITVSLIIVLLASSFKIYPIALLVLLVGFTLFKKVSPAAKVFWLILTGFALWLALTDVRNIPWLPSDARNSFGLRIFGEYFTYLFSGSGYQMLPLIGILLGLFIFLILTSLFNSSKVNKLYPQFKPSIETLLWFLFFLSIFVSGISIDYRLLFLLPSLPLLTSLNKTSSYAVMSLFFLSFYLSFPFEILQVVGDVSLFLLLSFKVVLLFKNRESIFRECRLWRLGTNR